MNINRLLLYFAVLLASLAVSFLAIRQQFDPKIIGLLIFLLVFVPTLINPNIGFVIIIVSMLFSPDVILGQTTAREITLRMEDMFLLVVILAAFTRAVFTKEVSKIFKTKLTVPFFLYIGVCILSTVFGYMFSQKIDIRYGLLSTLKYLEYFLLFLMVRVNMRSLRQAKIFVVIFLLVALGVSVHSHFFIQEKTAAHEEFFRTSPPVETRGAGQAGTLGGYAVFMLAIAAGLLFSLRQAPIRAFLFLLILLMFRAFLYTLSRGSYLAFLPMLFTLTFLSKKITFAYISVVFLILITLFMPGMVRDRITQTVTFKRGVERTYIELEDSPRFRLMSWRDILVDRFPASPVIGHGVGKYFIDSQVFLTLGEVGLLGLMLLIWVTVRLFKMTRDIFNNDIVKMDSFSRGLSLGFFAGLIGLYAQSISTNTFVIIRIMEPFWFLTAIVLCLPELLQKEKEALQGEKEVV